MEFITSSLAEVILIKPQSYGDERGFFMETYKQSVFAANGIDVAFLQDNHSSSTYGVLRGLHYQLAPKGQGKLVRCIAGEVFDVAVDVRHSSPNFGKWVGYHLSAKNRHMLYIPQGFAHGFLVLSPHAELVYKTTCEYAPQYDRGVRYDDPTINIIWPKLSLAHGYILSTKDSNLPLLAHAECM